MNHNNYILPLSSVGMDDVSEVGGKNASLGEMIANLAETGVKVPGGFATTSTAYWDFLAANGLKDKIKNALAKLDVNNVTELAKIGSTIRQWVIDAPLPAELETGICKHYSQMGDNVSVAVRSSATAEDLPDASFAGQQETYLNVVGIEAVLNAVKNVFASLFNDRAIAYRQHQGFAHDKVALSAGIQRMVRSDKASSGVMFTLDTESGFEEVVFITSSYGLGEMVVQGAVNPDEFYVDKRLLAHKKFPILRKNLGSKAKKMIFSETGDDFVSTVKVEDQQALLFSLTNDDIIQLAKFALLIEKHYQRPMDIEWGKDGIDGELYILQARPETVKSRDSANIIERYQRTGEGKSLTEGRAIGHKIGAGTVKVLNGVDEMDKVQSGDVLVTDMTDPDWEPIMKRASAIVTNRGGRTCHAAIIARELGIPAVVGCGNASHLLQTGQKVTVSCAEGDTGFVYEGQLPFNVNTINIEKMPSLPFKIMMNVGNPDIAFDFQKLPNEGVGLARLEFIINRMIGIHPEALLNLDKMPAAVKSQIDDLTKAYPSPVDFYVDKLAEGIAVIAASFYPKRVIVRLSDFKSNEYANLIGGREFEPDEENPMLGFRGASRYIDKRFQACFRLECLALKKVREQMGLDNVEVMVPFVRTLDEAEQVTELLAENGLKRGEHDLKLIMMCELPSNALLAEEFLAYFDGFSIGSNDMTQLTLGLDRDSGLVAHLFDERNLAVKKLLASAITACKKAGKYIGICGQGPSDHPDFAQWLIEQGIDSVSLNPDSVLETWMYLAKNLAVKAE